MYACSLSTLYFPFKTFIMSEGYIKENANTSSYPWCHVTEHEGMPHYIFPMHVPPSEHHLSSLYSQKATFQSYMPPLIEKYCLIVSLSLSYLVSCRCPNCDIDTEGY